MRRVLLLGASVVVIALAVFALSLSAVWSPGPSRGETIVFEVYEGESLSSVARRLEREGLLPRRALFGPRLLVWYARLKGWEREIKSGEYELAPGLTPVEILELQVAGSVKTYAVTLPEGLRLDEIAVRLEQARVVSVQSFLGHAEDPNFTRALDVEADSLEGYLYPETYRFRRDSSPQEVLRRMVEELRSRWTEDDHRRLQSNQLTFHEALTLASIVEKETAVAAERGLIAAVFRNRLKRGMRLQSDPTVIYGIFHARGSFDGNIRQMDLREDTPYNTYTRAGLPPGPIASMTMAAVRAVLSPEDVPYLFFVSRNDGSHHFSATLEEHNRAVHRHQGRAGPSNGPS